MRDAFVFSSDSRLLRALAVPTIPIAALTADASSEKANASKAAGMDTFLLKPLRSDGIASLRELAAEVRGPAQSPN